MTALATTLDRGRRVVRSLWSLPSFPGFQLRLTRWGVVYLILTLVLAFAAVNTGNNALMATLGLVLATYAVSGWWSREVLGATTVAVRAPRELFAGRPALFELEIANPGRFLPAYGLVLRDGEGRALHLVGCLDPGEVRASSAEVVFPRRGRHSLDDWRLEVLLPLGFFVKSKAVARGREVVVFPAMVGGAEPHPTGVGGGREIEHWRDHGREGEVSQLREYRDGDELRQIHWKQTARQARLITIDRQSPAVAAVMFVVDTRLPHPPSRRQLELFELILARVATAILHRLEVGTAVGLMMPGVIVEPLDRRDQLAVLLTPLAEARPLHAGAPWPDEPAADRFAAVRVGVPG